MRAPAVPAVAQKKTPAIRVTGVPTTGAVPKPSTPRQQPTSARTKPADVQTMLSRAEKLLAYRTNDFTPRLCLVVAGDAAQVVRPAALTDALGEKIREHTRAGRTRLLDPAESTNVRVQGDAVVVEQADASILADERGSIRIISTVPQRKLAHGLALGIVEEDVRDRITLMLRVADRVLKDIDPANLMTEVVIVGALLASSGVSWKTAAEFAQNPQSWTGSMKSGPFRVQLTPPQRPRMALTGDAVRIAADFTALLRRHVVGQG